ncbi:SRPBCC domain-containing protein [Kribbella qitaiheensis]|uniref:SRPBCC domain-containing protein n=1 Tax=Kribbella qitaiheensis TaxID=1544730 RepID=UPI00361E67BF
MIEPLVVEFEVAAPVTHAFDVWTGRCAAWWPPSHTVSGNPDAITFEPRPGGRIFETSPAGDEHLWGEILDWEPPGRLRFRWHLFFDPSEATEVELTFTPHPDGTVVRLEQTGWDKLGEPAASTRRERTGHAWSAITARFATAARDSAAG